MKTKLVSLKYKIHGLMRNHQAFVVLAVVLLVATVTIVRISLLNSLSVDQTKVANETAKLRPVKFNQKAIDKMQELQASNVKLPGAELPGNRQNPFSE